MRRLGLERRCRNPPLKLRIPPAMGVAISQPADGRDCKDSPLAVAAVAEITQCTCKLNAYRLINKREFLNAELM